MRYWTQVYYSFPIQLLLLHLKKNHFLLFFLILISLFFTNVLGSRYGISLLFLDPEYLGHVDFISFTIMGFAFGGTFISWNLISYIFNANHFPFLATLRRPFGVYSLNNSVLPAFFFILYLYKLIQFQSSEGLVSMNEALTQIGGLFSGMFLFITLTMLYFSTTNKSILQIIGRSNKKMGTGLVMPNSFVDGRHKFKDELRVSNYFNHDFKIKIARPVYHYPYDVIRSVYRQHHANALIIQLTALVIIILLGHLVDYPFFRIPAASSILLIINIGIVITGAFTYWLGQWKVLAAVIFLIVVNVIISSNFLQYKNRAMGIDYKNTSVDYSIATLKSANSIENIDADKAVGLEILNNWKNKFDSAPGKPKLVLLNVSGGGLRSTMFTMRVLQMVDSITNGGLMNHTVLITGASGGMIAASYYRELYYRKLQGDFINLASEKYLNNISSDLLNAVSFTLVVNDFFYPLDKFKYNNQTFRKDRGYIFEKVLHENTDSMLFKPMSAYVDAEYKMQIPMLLFYPTIINDERQLFIGAQRFSFMCVPYKRMQHFSLPEVNGVDIHDLLGKENGDNLLLSTAIRMNCTFPYILPKVHLPTNPSIEVMDAGIRDNYGIETSVRYAATFQDWILKNTSGVIMLNIRGIEQEKPIQEKVSQGIYEKLFNPVGSLYMNWVEIQDYQNDFSMEYLNTMLKGKMEVITIDYQPPANRQRASLSLHLTAREKKDIVESANSEKNHAAYNKLKTMLSY